MKDNDVKFCICAMIDLLGFSSHLETSGYDLRTSIGEQAIKRLQNLEDVVESLKNEKNKRPEFYPEPFYMQRINDAIFITMDIDDILKPAVGHTAFQGISLNEFENFVLTEKNGSFEEYQAASIARIQIAIEPLIKFVGVISRLHISLNKMESESFFPGAKSVISTGFRRPFKDDFFSANFALSNAYIAEKSLHGPLLYLDEGILHLLSLNRYTRNLVRFAHFQFKTASFDCFDDNDYTFYSTENEASITKAIEIRLLRKLYQFRELNASPLTYLENVPLIIDYLNGTSSPNLSNIFFKHVFNAIKNGIPKGVGKTLKVPPSFLFNKFNDLDNDIGILQEFLTTGRSITQEERKNKQFEEEYSHLTEEGKSKIRSLLDQEVEIELEQIDISECRNQLFNLSEEMLTGIMLVLKGDIEQLDYNYESRSLD